jgi:hypothetical protein
MKLTDLTEASVRAFAEPTIFGRGESYFRQKVVYELTYDPKRDRIASETHGSQGDYEQEIWISDNRIGGRCDCPYDGFPCKHLVAALLTFIADKQMYVAQAGLRKKKQDSLRASLLKLPKEKLIELLIDGASSDPDFKNGLLLKLQPDSSATLGALKKQIHRAYPSMSPDQSMHFDAHSAAKQLRKILTSLAESDNAQLKAEVYLCMAERVLEEFDQYGGGDDKLEDIATDAIAAFTDVICNEELPPDSRTDLIERFTELEQYSNSGLEWAIDDATATISETDDE